MSDIERLADLLYEMWATTGRKLGATETEMRAASRGDAETLIARGVTVGVRDPSPPEPDIRNFLLTDAALRGALKRVRTVLSESDAPRLAILALDDIELHIQALGVRGAGVVPPEEPKS